MQSDLLAIVLLFELMCSAVGTVAFCLHGACERRGIMRESHTFDVRAVCGDAVCGTNVLTFLSLLVTLTIDAIIYGNAGDAPQTVMTNFVVSNERS